MEVVLLGVLAVLWLAWLLTPLIATTLKWVGVARAERALQGKRFSGWKLGVMAMIGLILAMLFRGESSEERFAKMRYREPSGVLLSLSKEQLREYRYARFLSSQGSEEEKQKARELLRQAPGAIHAAINADYIEAMPTETGSNSVVLFMVFIGLLLLGQLLRDVVYPALLAKERRLERALDAAEKRERR